MTAPSHSELYRAVSPMVRYELMPSSLFNATVAYDMYPLELASVEVSWSTHLKLVI